MTPTLYLYGKELPVKPYHKFLGLIVDKKLSWANHINDLRAKSIKALGALETVSHKDWGGDRSTLYFDPK